MTLILIGIGCGIVGVLGATFTIRSYDEEQAAKNARAEAESRLSLNLTTAQATAGRLSRSLEAAQADLAKTHAELAEARARSAAAEVVRKKRTKKLVEVSGLVNTAMAEGDRIRKWYLTEQAKNPREFEERFDALNSPALEKWRGETAVMLNDALKPLQMGDSFTRVDGVYIGSRAAYGISRVINCISWLNVNHAALPALVERVTE
ncbi:MAG TPA: hypothetical protein VJP78_00090 [Thermoleophilia bacterium]|nr:hypothetical protein [Thermoleophilia bacterium]